MANWISSKLKVAETFLEQIDNQAAESLKKNERARSDEEERFDVPAKSGASLSLKEQLKKKKQEMSTNSGSDYQGKLRLDPIVNNVNSNSINGRNNSRGSNATSRENVVLNTPKPSPKSKPTLTDSDWTELLSTPNEPKAVPSRGSGVMGINALKKDGRKQGNLSAIEGKRSWKGNRNLNGVGSKSRDGLIGNEVNGKPSDGEESSSSARSSSAELHSDAKIVERRELNRKDLSVDVIGKEKNNGDVENMRPSESKDISNDVMMVANRNLSSELLSALGKVDGVANVQKGVGDVYDRLRSTVKGKRRSDAASRSSISDKSKRYSSSSDEGSDTNSDSGSSSDSENERERERREKILAEKLAAKASEAIKERENMVARLEGEKQSLEKILEERAKQQVQEATELQTTMMETMEAVELEKQKHNNTRMEAFPRLAKLETANADLARSLAIAQKNLEEEINHIAELRQQCELKDVALEERRRRMSEILQAESNLSQFSALKGVGFEREILEAEHAFLIDKIGRMEDKAKELEANIEMTRKEIEDPTEVEIELKQRLRQLTDHLIQKQAQVESLSSEKATQLFRIEAISRMLEENKSMAPSDVESGAWEMSDSKFKPLLEQKIRSGRKHLGSLVQQLDAIFLAGQVFLRRNPTAKLWSLVYLVCLHFWVIYILLSQSHASNEGRSGAVISLENINNTIRS